MWCGTLQFEYAQNDQLVAKNATHTMPIEEQFDFDDYQIATDTRPCPPMFQKLVQKAIAFYLSEHNGSSNFRVDIWRKMANMYTRFPATINFIIFEYANEYVSECSIPGFNTSLLPHQIEAVEFLSSRPASLLAAATGLGKTAVSLAFATNQQLKRVLLVCPPSLQSNWQNEIRKFIEGAQDATAYCNFDETKVYKRKQVVVPVLDRSSCPLYVCVDHAADAKRIFDRVTHISKTRLCFVLLRYNLLNALNDLLVKNRFDIVWDAMVFDEGHALKCSKSQRSSAAFSILQRLRPRFRVLLSATPSPSTKDWWNLLRIMDPKIFAKFFHYKPPGPNYPASQKDFFFAERYIHPRAMRTAGDIMRWNFDTSARMKELHALTRPYVLCQTKNMLNLPPFLREYVVVGEATKEQQARFCARIQTIVAANGSLCEMQTSFQQLVQQASADKMPFVKHHLLHLLESSSERFIVWVHFKLTMQDLAQFLKDNAVKYIAINGDTPQQHRDEYLDMFEHDDTIRIALLSIDTCGTGLNMTFINTSVYAELTYNHVAQIQSEGRCHRIGQTATCVTALYLIVKHSPDELIWNSMLRKADIESLVLTNKKADFDFQTRDIKDDLMQYLKEMQTQKPDIWQRASSQITSSQITSSQKRNSECDFVFSSAKRKKQL